jgi:fatty acid desaturase
MQIILGILITATGTFMVIKTEWILLTFGRVSWFDEKLGSEGGSRLGYKLLGVLILFIGIIMMTGSGDLFFGWVFSPLTKLSNPGQ